MMKNILAAIAIAGVVTGCGNHISESKLPSVVVNTVKAKYNTSEKIEWEKTTNGYEAEVKVGTQETTVLVNTSGNILMQKHEINKDDLPAAVTTAIITGYKEHEIDEVEVLEKDGVDYYQVELDSKGSNKDVELVFTIDGKQATGIAFWK
jgi:uncharacterized membrane protein YkoI